MKEIKICRRADTSWKEIFNQRKNPQGQKYYWLTGNFIHLDREKDTTLWGLENTFVLIISDS